MLALIAVFALGPPRRATAGARDIASPATEPVEPLGKTLSRVACPDRRSARVDADVRTGELEVEV
jgi:hypothetical protein